MYSTTSKPTSRYNAADMEKKVTSWGAFTPQEAHILIPMQERVGFKKQALPGDTEQLLALLSKPAPNPGIDSADEVRKTMCMTLLTATLTAFPPSETQKQACTKEIIGVLSQSNRFSAGLVISALVCAMKTHAEEAKPFALPLVNNSDSRISRLATEFCHSK